MRRRTALVLGIALTVLFCSAAAQAASPIARVTLGGSFIEGKGWPVSTEVKVTLADSAGRLKAVCRNITHSDGGLYCAWGQGVFAGSLLPPATSEPGDRMNLEVGGASYASGPLSDMRLAGLDPAADRVTGRVVPRRGVVRVSSQFRRRLTPTGWTILPEYAKTGPTDADGDFDIDLSSAWDAARNDTVFVGALQGRFEVGVSASFPGLDIQKDSNYGFLSGIPGSRHLVRLLGPGGALKAGTEVTLGSGPLLSATDGRSRAAIARGGAGAVFFFVDGAGRAVRMLEGDTIAVGGAGAFSLPVPKLAPGMSGTRFSVRTLPNRPLSFSGQAATGPTSWAPYNAYGKSDAAGLYRYDISPTTITPYSTCRFTIVVGGNLVSTSRTLAP